MSELKSSPKRITGKFVIPLLILFTLSSLIFWLVYPFPSDEQVDYVTEMYPIIHQDIEVEFNGIREENKLYLPFEYVKKYIDNHIHYDTKSSSIIVTTKDKVYQMETDGLDYTINDQDYSMQFPTIISETGMIYISTELLTKIYPINLQFSEDTTTIQVREHGDTIITGEAISDFNKDLFRLREAPDVTTPYVEELTVNEKVIIVEEKDQFYLVRKENGIAGYVKKEIISIKDPKTIEVDSVITAKPFPLPTLDWPIHLTWDAIYQLSSTPTSTPKYDGVQVISPTWFHLDDEVGTVRSYAKTEYVKDAKSNGYLVWALFSNDFNAERTHEVLKDYETRKKVIKQLLQYASIYELDGYNIDFENVMLEDGPLLTQFMREFTPLAHEAGLVVSMDITFISTNERYSMFYERAELSEVVDYLIVMAYDEHWATSPKAGSVASLPWVEENLQRLLEEVPNDRLLLGVPLYTRLWTETSNEDGSITVESQSMSMDQVEEWIENHQVTPKLDEESGQLYVESTNDEENITYKIWIENELSIQKRTELVHKYNLAGMASWSDYFASEAIWKDINESLRTISVVSVPDQAEN